MKKKLLFYSFLFCLFFILSFVISYIISPINCDEIWSYGFSYNLTNNLMIYKDYNALQAPLYFLIAKHFITLFGKYIISIHIFDSILMSIIGVILYKKIKYKAFIIFPLLLIYNPNPYNLLCLAFLFLIILLLDIDDTELLIAFIIGLIFITKQNIGILLFPTLFLNKDKKNSFFMFIAPFLFISIYLLINGAYFDFIDQAFLGLLDFNSNNKLFMPIWTIFELLSLIYLFYLLIKNKFNNKEIIYILLFQIMLYPIIDPDHFAVSFIPVFYLMCKNIKLINIQYVIYTIVICITIIGIPTHININLNKDLFFLRSPKEIVDITHEINNYFNGNLKNVFGDTEHIYFTKLYYDEPISEFDFLLSGNIGFNGSTRKFNKLKKYCEKNDCFFVITNNNFKQTEEFREFIKANYKKVDNFSIFSVYH